VESFLDRVVAPIAGQRRVLLIVLDGMSAAIAPAIGDQLSTGWSGASPWSATAGPSSASGLTPSRPRSAGSPCTPWSPTPVELGEDAAAGEPVVTVG
ncbi:hypothetical protein, partial [Nocardia abscessus]|uniref:hypothetical protein n=1 Tax=Nocardia abscessus TaxID=120957 RepID=UPI0024561220